MTYERQYLVLFSENSQFNKVLMIHLDDNMSKDKNACSFVKKKIIACFKRT